MYRLTKSIFCWCAVIVIEDENDSVDVIRHDHKFPQYAANRGGDHHHSAIRRARTGATERGWG